MTSPPWASAGGVKWTFAPWKFGLRSKHLLKTQNKQFISISWVNSCNNSLFADVPLTAQESVRCSGIMQS